MTHVISFDVGSAQRRIGVNVATSRQLFAEIDGRLNDGQGFALATLNLDHLAKLRCSRAFRAAYAAQDIVVADGNPVVWLSRLAGRGVELMPGSELIEPICALAAARGARVAMFGATESTLSAAARRLERANPGLRVAHLEAPAFGFDPEGPEADAAIARIAASGARICFVALGAPKQEIFAARARLGAPACGFVSIGAGLDFIAGAQLRAPRAMRALALEWLWRLALQPRRLGRRYLDCAMLLPRLTLDALRNRAAEGGPHAFRH
ncbi:WecB/TagA/CpsF family glycosyltransferase [Oceanicella actignis]|uniref:WecB/TagA/CpsF family glycosyltransferase n=1 Tax=Oceanicella actignis TaxID=1189325 RepID=UPI0011E84FB0|nr:WecB/TagA/CpsF family glycosyltransferase [Oceanicella actignis]TYO83956.1 exopolysaccharide biosynthesis WecB/TagA/CpsF family protein [Oceanicella actignis]